MATEQKTYPCDPATLEELSNAIMRISIGYSKDKDDLNAILFPVSPEWIPWSAIGNLFILGNHNQRCNDALKNAGLKPGAYINHSGDALLLIHPPKRVSQEHLDRCPRLKTLWIRHARFSSLDLSGAGSLEELSLIQNHALISLPGLEKLSRLTTLNLLDCTSLTQLPCLENLSQLTYLDLSYCTGLTTLPDGLRKLEKLRLLDLSFLKLQTLPNWLPEITEDFSTDPFPEEGMNKANVGLYRTTVADIPDMSIFDQPYEVIAEFFRNRSLGKTRALNEIKVVFLGDGEAGKSHTIARLMNDGGEPKGYVDVRTPGIVIKDKLMPIGDRISTLHLWDFGGQDIMHSMHRIFLTERTIYVVLVDGSIGNQDERARYWLQNIQSFAKDAPVILVLNKLDDGLQADVNAVDLYNKYSGLKRIVKLSAKQYSQDRFNREFTEVLNEEICKTGYLNAQWPETWIRVKQELEQMKRNYIRGGDYLDICQSCNVEQNQQALLEWFHDLGISFCYHDSENRSLEDYVVLRPNWITNALYIILFNEREGGNGGLVPILTIQNMLSRKSPNREAIKRVIPDAYYEGYDVNYVLDVFHVFQLSFQKDSTHEFFPMLADVNAKPVAREYADDPTCLEFRMEFDYLPNNLLHRLMVERNTELDMNNVWRTGAKFQLTELGLSAVVVIDGNALRFFIQSENPMHRSNIYLAILKANVDRIVKKMGLKEPKNWLIYKLDDQRDEFSYEMLNAMQKVGQKEVFSMSWNKMIPIEDILTQSAPQLQKDERKLLDAITRACRHLQNDHVYRLKRNADGSGYENGHDMEDLRNRRVRDDLHTGGYIVSDQTQRGGGDLDILVYGENNEPWTIIEALRVSDGTKRTWNQHLDKLLGRYNTHGLPRLYLLTYVDADPQTFIKVWKGYQGYIPTNNSGEFTCDKDSFTLLTDENDPHYIRAAKCRYTCDTAQTTVYHIFARIPTENE